MLKKKKSLKVSSPDFYNSDLEKVMPESKQWYLWPFSAHKFKCKQLWNYSSA